MGVNPSAMVVELGLGGSFRERLITAGDIEGAPATVSCWPLSEVASSRARDIAGEGHHGTYVGSGFTRGVTVPLPEGALSLTFDSNGYIEVPDDSPDDDPVLNLSVAGGGFDIVFLLKTSTNDATLRAIVQKMVTDSAGNGWSVSLQSGAIVFRLEVAGTEVFNFSRGAISDGAWHLVNCVYEPEDNRARIFIDGVQSGAQVAATTEPAVTAANLRIGSFNDGAGRFIGTLAYVMVSREGNATLPSELQATRAWTNVTADLRASVAPIDAQYGIRGSGLADTVAGTGTMTFALDNSTKNSGGVQGYYSPGHASARSGFTIGIPVRLSLTYSGTTYYKFRGTIKAVKPLAGQFRAQYVSVTCVDWIHVAASDNAYLAGLTAQVDQRSDTVFGHVMDHADRPPAAITIGTGTETFPYALDSIRGPESPLLPEFARIADSERGFIYLKGDTVQGGTLVYEGRSERQLEMDDAASFSNTMRELEVEFDLAVVINIVRGTVYPRTVDAAATTVLYSLPVGQASQPIAPGQSVVVEGTYRDPVQKAAQVGGVDMVAPVETTDYTMHTAADGTGTDLTASFSVEADLGGNRFRVTITNNGSTTGYLTKFQVRGRGIYHYEPVTVERRDEDSVRQHGPHPVSLDSPYLSAIPTAQGFGDMILHQFSEPVAMARSMTFVANTSDALMTQALAREVGDRIGIVETITGINASAFIQEVHLQVEAPTFITVTWTLMPALTIQPWVLGEVGASELDQTTVPGV